MKLLKRTDFDSYPANLRDKAVWVVLKATGIRCGELINIKVSDVNLTDRTLRIIDSKKKCPYILPLSNECCLILSVYMNSKESGQQLSTSKSKESSTVEDSYLFPSNHRGKTRMTRTNIQHIIHQYNSVLSPRNFRHFFARNWILKKGDLISLQSILRHKNLEMTIHYASQIRFLEEDAQIKAEYHRIFA